jgi:hypothetical protein
MMKMSLKTTKGISRMEQTIVKRMPMKAQLGRARAKILKLGTICAAGERQRRTTTMRMPSKQKLMRSRRRLKHVDSRNSSCKR